MPAGYEAFFGLFERPFSLTPDARYHFRSRAHARALGGLSTALSRRTGLLLLTGDLGTGKSTMCRMLQRTYAKATQVVYVSNALLSREELLQRLIRELADAPGEAPLADASPDERLRLALRLRNAPPPLLLVDEANRLPPAAVDVLLGLVSSDHRVAPLAHVVLAAQPPAFGSPTLPRALDGAVAFRARLGPLDQDEYDAYIQHRLHVAGGGPVPVAPRTIEILHALSGGVPRLVNLLCERALHAAATEGVRRLEPGHFEHAAVTLELRRLRERRFRWYGTAAAGQR